MAASAVPYALLDDSKNSNQSDANQLSATPAYAIAATAAPSASIKLSVKPEFKDMVGQALTVLKFPDEYLKSLNFDDVDLESAAIIATIPNGREALTKYYDNDTKTVDQVVAIGLSAKAQSLKNEINASVNKKTADINMKTSIPGGLAFVTILGSSLAGVSALIKTNLINIAILHGLENARNDAADQLRTFCPKAPADSSSSFFNYNCPSDDYAIKPTYYDLVAKYFNHCQSSLWSSYEAICIKLNGTPTEFNSGGKIVGDIVLALVAAGAAFGAYYGIKYKTKITEERTGQLIFTDAVIPNTKRTPEETAVLAFVHREEQFKIGLKKQPSIQSVVDRLASFQKMATHNLLKMTTPPNKGPASFTCRFFKKEPPQQTAAAPTETPTAMAAMSPSGASDR